MFIGKHVLWLLFSIQSSDYPVQALLGFGVLFKSLRLHWLISLEIKSTSLS